MARRTLFSCINGVATLVIAIVAGTSGLAGCHLIYPFNLEPVDASVVAVPDAGPIDLSKKDGGDGSVVLPNKVWQGEEKLTNGSLTSVVQGLGPIDKAFVLCSFRTSHSDPSYLPTCQLTKAGVRIEGPPGPVTVKWYVVRLAGAQVLRGKQELDKNTSSWTSLPLAIDPQRAFILQTSATNASSSSDDSKRMISATLTSDKRLKLARSVSSAHGWVEWQVVQLTGAKVQHETSKLLAASLKENVTLAAPVIPDKTLLFFSVRVDDSGGKAGYESVYHLRGQITDPQHLRFDRRATGAVVEIAWFTVELSDGSLVRRGNEDLVPPPNQVLLITRPVNPQVVRDRSVVLPSSNIDVTSSWPAQLDAVSFTGELGVDGGEVVLRRGNYSNYDYALGLAWQVWQIPL